MTVVPPTNTYFVALNGNDAWSGLLSTPNSTNTDGPFKTLARAQAAMRASTTIKTATIRAGTYSLTTNLTFDSQDNGETWEPYPFESPTIDGGGTGFITGNSGNFAIEGLTFKDMGVDPNDATLHWSGSGGVTIRWNTFENCKVSCVNGQLSNAFIDSNDIEGSGSGEFHGAISLWYGASNNTISHNLIQNATEEGINISAGSSDPAADNNKIDRNILNNTCNNATDCGAIYMYDAAHNGTGNQITNNVIDGVGNYTSASTAEVNNLTKSIYLDDGVSNVLISGNTCRACGEYGIQYHGGDHNTVTNNIFDLSSGASEVSIYQSSATTYADMAGNTFTNNIVYSANNFHNPLWNLGINAPDVQPADNNNLYYSATNASIPNSIVIDSAPHTANPQFNNPSNGDYTMPLSSPAYTQINWHTLPTDQGPLANPFM